MSATALPSSIPTSAMPSFIGVGVGYNINNWLRIDATGEYRSKARVYACGIYDQMTGQGDDISGLPEVLGGPRQRLYRSRHLGLLHALHRLRHRWRLQHPVRFHRYRIRYDRPGFRPQLEQMESRLGAACRRLLQCRQESEDRARPTAISITALSPTPSTAPAAATRIPTSSATCIPTTSRWACAGPVAKSRSRPRSRATSISRRRRPIRRRQSTRRRRSTSRRRPTSRRCAAEG